MNRVFVLMPTDKPLEGAARFGELVAVYDAESYRPSVWDPEFVRQALARMSTARYDPLEDLVVVTGPVMPVTTWIGALCAKYGQIRALCFDYRYQQYVDRVVGDVTSSHHKDIKHVDAPLPPVVVSVGPGAAPRLSRG